MTENKIIEILKKMELTSEQAELVLQDFKIQYHELELSRFDEVFEGVYDSFETFCKEFHADTDEEQIFNNDYINEMSEFFCFCPTSGAIFKQIGGLL